MRDTNTRMVGFYIQPSPSEIWQPRTNTKIPFKIISKGDNLRFYRSHVFICKAVFSVYTHTVELAFSVVRSFLMADEMKIKRRWMGGKNIKHDISTHILITAQTHKSYTTVHTHTLPFSLLGFFLSQMWVFSHSLCFSRSHRFNSAPLPSPCTLSRWPSSGRTWTALFAQASRLCDVHAAVLAQGLSAVRELRQSGSCSADTCTQVVLYCKVERIVCLWCILLFCHRNAQSL